MLLFTVTAGRTGTAWLADFLGANYRVEAIHEQLGHDDIGLHMPDIRVMRTFNTVGRTPVVDAFWERKLSLVDGLVHCETNHTFAKAGLIEYLAEHEPTRPTVLVCLRRDRASQAASYLARFDFANTTTAWQWYIDHRSPNVIVEPERLVAHGELAPVLWYVLEMEARQRYYRRRFEDRFMFLEHRLDELVTETGATRLVTELDRCLPGLERRSGVTPVLPARANQSRHRLSAAARARVEEAIAAVEVDPDVLAVDFIAAGGRLDDASRPRR